MAGTEEHLRMSAAQNLPPSDRTRAILEDLEAVRENLLALSDDICPR